MQTFAEQLSAMRKERHITQEQLAQELNVSRTTISRWESGKVLPDIETIKHLSQILNYNFFAVEGLAEETNAPAVEHAVRKRNRLGVFAVGGLCLLVLCLFLLSGLVENPSNGTEQEGQSASQLTVETVVEKATSANIVVTTSKDVAYLESFGDSGYGWYASFCFENHSDVPFTPDGVDVTFYENEAVALVLTTPYEDLKAQMDGGRLVKGGALLEFPVSANMMNLTHVVCRIYGTDDNGHAVDLSATVRYVCELASMAEAGESALQAAGAADPNAAHIVAMPSKDVAYLEPFGESGYGWNVIFFFSNHGDVPFTPEKMVINFYSNEEVASVIDVSREELRPGMNGDKLVKDGGSLYMPVGANMLYMTHVTCTLYGTDDNGNAIEASATVQYSQRHAD